MQCPTDGTLLVMSERSGIEIDYCPTCRGVWLDRGELDKILERAAGPAAQAAPAASGWTAAAPAPAPYPPQGGGWSAPPSPSPGWQRDPRHDHREEHRGKHRKSWLSELFD